MKSIGLDIGTSTICAVLVDADTGRVTESVTLENTSSLAGHTPFEKLQDPTDILAVCNQLIDSFLQNNKDIISIGLTGQMHGILYVNEKGSSVSPLYTWQDARGDEPYHSSLSYSRYMTEITGFPIASGFGMTTHFYNIRHHLVPESASSFCTIADYIGMKLTNQTKPVLHKSMAASLGLYELDRHRFSAAACGKLGLSADLLPSIAENDCIIGTTMNGIPVSIALGDNQSSFLASVDNDSACLANVGTGSQVSMCTNSIKNYAQVECRPFIDEKYLLVGSSLCGGYSYALLKNFFKKILDIFDAKSNLLTYETMNKLANEVYFTDNALTIDTRLRGTRNNPHLTGSITNLNEANFHPAYLISGTLQGICNELYEYYLEFPEKSSILIGSGNGIRKNPVLQKLLKDTFQINVKIPAVKEEAALGSALFSLYTIQYYSSLEEIQSKIKYL